MKDILNTSGIRKVFWREVRRISKSNILIFITLIGPLLAYGIIWWLFSAGVVRDVPVAIVDHDDSPLSAKVIRLIDASPVCKVVVRSASETEAKKLMDGGKIDGIIVVPHDLERDVLRESSPELAVFINNTNMVKGGALKSGLYTTLSTISAGIKVQVAIKKGETPDKAITDARPVRTDAHLLFNPFGNYSYFLALGLLPLLSVVFIFLGTVYAIGIELKEGTSGELMDLAGQNISTALTGKVLPYSLLYFIDLTAMNLLLIRVMETPVHGSLFVILLSELALISSYQFLAVMFIKITANLRLSLSLGSAYTMMAMTFSGLTFPLAAMPLAAQWFSAVFPYTFWLRIFMSQTLRGTPVSDTIVLFIYFIPFVIAGRLAFPGLKRKMTNPKYWFRE
jgi:ABC-2 type transport system permease protein